MSSNQFDLEDAPSDVISSTNFAPKPQRTTLLVSSWDKHVYVYNVEASAGEQLLLKIVHRSPVLDACWGADDKEAFSASLDHTVHKLNIQTGESTILSTHKGGVRRVVYSSDLNVLISASWDCTLHIHALSKPSGHAPAIISLPAKPFSLSLTSEKLVVAMANRIVHIYDLKPLEILSLKSNNSAEPIDIEPWQRRESSMKFMTRAVACMPSGLGYASSSIEGRVSVEWFDPSEEAQSKKYAFKCHRETAPDGVDVIYPVNCLSYHPVHTGTFASGGGDGHVALWDGITKRRIRQYQKYPASVADLAFSSDGKYLAVGYSPGFEDGMDDMNGPIGISVREMSENEAKGKDKK